MTSLSTKICLIGDFAAGKTSLIRRFVYAIFDDKYLSTIGVKVSRKTIPLVRQHASGGEDVVEMTMMLWDLAGSEEFDRVRSSYLRGAAGAILVCDLTRPETLDSLPGYANDLWSASPGARLVLAANKCDLTEQQQISTSQLYAVAAQLNASYYLTSAKADTQVELVFHHLGGLLLPGAPNPAKDR
ncbi:MAG: GTP-binding protein [Anaerolineae bacterium]|nr:GTP-binding protein [Anaerolineae bacterium]